MEAQLWVSGRGGALLILLPQGNSVPLLVSPESRTGELCLGGDERGVTFPTCRRETRWFARRSAELERGNADVQLGGCRSAELSCSGLPANHPGQGGSGRC